MTELILIALFVFAMWFADVRDAYDQERWRVDPYYPRYGATLREVMRWRFTGKMRIGPLSRLFRREPQ